MDSKSRRERSTSRNWAGYWTSPQRGDTQARTCSLQERSWRKGGRIALRTTATSKNTPWKGSIWDHRCWKSREGKALKGWRNCSFKSIGVGRERESSCGDWGEERGDCKAEGKVREDDKFWTVEREEKLRGSRLSLQHWAKRPQGNHRYQKRRNYQITCINKTPGNRSCCWSKATASWNRSSQG